MLTAYGLNEYYDFSDPLPDSTTGFKGVWYCAERAKSGRSECRCCKQKIANSTLRIGVCQDVSQEFRGGTCGFFHPACFFKVIGEKKEYWARKVTSTNQIQNFSTLTPAHKKELEGYIGGGSSKTSSSSSSPAKKAAATPAAPTYPKNPKNVLFRYDQSQGVFIAIGNTIPVKEVMKDYGGSWNYHEKYWYFEDEEEIADIVGKAKRNATWSKEMTVNAIHAAGEEEMSDSDDDEDFDSADEEDEESDCELHSDSEMADFVVHKKKAVPPQKKSYSFAPTPVSAPVPTPVSATPLPFQFKPKTVVQTQDFNIANASNFSYHAEATPVLPTEVVYPQLHMEKSGVSMGPRSSVQQDPLPTTNIHGMFQGCYVYFVPGCAYTAAPTARLKKMVRENGGVIVNNISQSTYVIVSRERAVGGVAGEFKGCVVAENWITDSVSRGSVMYNNNYAV